MIKVTLQVTRDQARVTSHVTRDLVKSQVHPGCGVTATTTRRFMTGAHEMETWSRVDGDTFILIKIWS